jgi:hypothetical protein
MEIAKCDRSRKVHRRRFITVQYEPIDDGDFKAWVSGEEIRKKRAKAAFKTTYDIAVSCKWSQSAQMRYERPGRHKMHIENIWTFIRVCNGLAN